MNKEQRVFRKVIKRRRTAAKHLRVEREKRARMKREIRADVMRWRKEKKIEAKKNVEASVDRAAEMKRRGLKTKSQFKRERRGLFV